MIIQNSHIPIVSMNDVAFILAKDKNTDRILKIPPRVIEQLVGSVIEIVQFMGKVIPAGLLLCDGKMYHKDNFPTLYNVIQRYFSKHGDPLNTFRVPDLVTGNRFLLHGDRFHYMPANEDACSNGSDKCSHIYCADNILNHSHVTKSVVNENSYYGYTTAGLHSQWFNTEYAAIECLPSGSSETAGKNMAVNFCIRTGTISEKGLERETTDGQVRETTYSETRIVTFSN